MADGRTIFLLLNLALGFYNVGTIWAHEVDIFRSWRLVDAKDFHHVQSVHWKKLPYWVLTPVVGALLGSVALVWYHPIGSPPWAIWATLLCLGLSFALTALFWGRWQSRLAKDDRGPHSPYLAKILHTHWVRTALINAYAFILLVWTIMVL
jgi:hypothetical protein